MPFFLYDGCEPAFLLRLDLSIMFIFVKIFLLALIQNVSFSMVSRSRNRDNLNYHIIAAFFSNTIWFMTMRELVLSDMTFWLFIPYTLGTVIGSVWGVKQSMKIERWLDARSDSHLVQK
jgi:hypothetical protein